MVLCSRQPRVSTDIGLNWMAKNHKSKPALLNKNNARRYLKSFCFCCLLRQCGAGAGLLSNPGVGDCQCEGQTHSQASHGEYISHSKIIHIYDCFWCFKHMMVACESLAPCFLPDFEGWVSPSGSVCLRRCKLADKEVFTVLCVGIWVSSEKEGAIIGMALKKEMGDAYFKVFPFWNVYLPNANWLLFFSQETFYSDTS